MDKYTGAALDLMNNLIKEDKKEKEMMENKFDLLTKCYFVRTNNSQETFHTDGTHQLFIFTMAYCYGEKIRKENNLDYKILLGDNNTEATQNMILCAKIYSRLSRKSDDFTDSENGTSFIEELFKEDVCNLNSEIITEGLNNYINQYKIFDIYKEESTYEEMRARQEFAKSMKDLFQSLIDDEDNYTIQCSDGDISKS